MPEKSRLLDSIRRCAARFSASTRSSHSTFAPSPCVTYAASGRLPAARVALREVRLHAQGFEALPAAAVRADGKDGGHAIGAHSAIMRCSQFTSRWPITPVARVTLGSFL